MTARKPKKPVRDYHARLVVHDLPQLDWRELKRLKQWLHLLADDLSLSPKEYADEFRAKLMK